MAPPKNPPQAYRNDSVRNGWRCNIRKNRCQVNFLETEPWARVCRYLKARDADESLPCEMPERFGICIDNVVCGRTMPLLRTKLRRRDDGGRINCLNSRHLVFRGPRVTSGSIKRIRLTFGVAVTRNHIGDA